MWQDFTFFCRQTTGRQTDGQNRLLNPASRMRTRSNDFYTNDIHVVTYLCVLVCTGEGMWSQLQVLMWEVSQEDR